MVKDLPVDIPSNTGCTWWYWFSRGQYLLVPGGTGLVLDGTGWYLVVLGQYKALLAGI